MNSDTEGLHEANKFLNTHLVSIYLFIKYRFKVNLNIYIVLFLYLYLPFYTNAQCPTCGNGIIDVGETSVNCPVDVIGTNMTASCSSPCAQPAGKDPIAGQRLIGIDFSTATTAYYSPLGATAATLPQTLVGGWTFAGAPSATTSGLVPASDAFGNQTGVVFPTSCCANNQNGFVTASFSSSGTPGAGGCSGLLGANFDGQLNTGSNPSMAVLRGGSGGTKPTLNSPIYNTGTVNVFKIQFFIGANTTPGLGWNCATNPSVFLDFSVNGTNWTQIMQLKTGTSSDMCSGATSNTSWFTEGSWSRVCLTVFKTAASGNHIAGNYYANAASNTAPSGIMVDPQWFNAGFRYRLRYVSNGCDGNTAASNFAGIKPPGNPGRYVYVDFPVFTSGSECIPCGLSFTNMCGFGNDNNDDGVGSDLFTTSTVPIGTLRRGVNMAEKGVEIFTLNGTSLTGSIFSTNDNLCDAEGTDKQCITNGGIAIQFLITQDYQPSGSCSSVSIPTVNYYKLAGHGASTATAQSVQMSPVTAAAKVNIIGWRSRATIFMNCNTTNLDLFGACNGYLFTLPTAINQPRGFYNLYIDNTTGKSTSVYGATSTCRGYFGGPAIAPISDVDLTQVGTVDGTACASGVGLVFTADALLCNGAPVSTMNVSIFSLPSLTLHSQHNSGADGTIAITVPGDYLIETQPTGAGNMYNCIDCKRKVCVTVTQAMIDACVVLPISLQEWYGIPLLTGNELYWKVTNESELDYYDLQRSTDGQTFETIKTVDALGSGQYTYQDKDAAQGWTYYRLLTISFDGSAETSNIIVVQRNEVNEGFLVYPIPAKNILSVQLDNEAASTEAIIEISGLFGNKLLEYKFPLSVGINNMDIPLQKLPAGTYQLRMQTNKGVSKSVRIQKL
jgi:hypothetical protein